MSDRYLSLVNSPIGKNVASRLGLPRPAQLRRYAAGEPALDGAVLVGTVDPAGAGTVADLVAGSGLTVGSADSERTEPDRHAGIVFDATGVTGVADLAKLRDFLAGPVKKLRPSGRVVLIGRTPGTGDPALDAARQALDGIVRSLAKELRAGATANLVQLADDADVSAAGAALRFFLSARSAYVDGQVVVAGPAPVGEVADWNQPLAGKVALVTGAARGIGAAIADVLARDGARVIAADLPAAGQALTQVANRISGSTLLLDIASAEAPERLAEHVESRFGGNLDIVVHNAGITRDKLMANMTAKQWDPVLAVNLESQLRINESLLSGGLLAAGGRVVSLASTSGIAGNRGQTNYAASKAGVIGMVRSSAARFAEHGATINAVAPGFIDTDMTHAMPMATREVARRLNSLQQAGLPVDVAETVSFLSWPASGGITGQVVRVCGQNLVGA